MASQTSNMTTFDPPALGRTPNPIYANVTSIPISETTQLITIAGQIGQRPDGAIPGDLGEQMEVCLSRVEACLVAAGGQIADLTRLNYYLTEAAWENPKALDLVYQKCTPWLKGHRPASTLLVVKALAAPGYLCEFEGQAVIGN